MICNQADRLAVADGFIGAIMGFEGIADGATVLNGPTGCKMYLGEAVHDAYRREKVFSQMKYAEEFYFQQPRVPCTYLDDYDYVFGASEKLEYVFGRVSDKGGAFIGVLNSPGASLIGDDLDGYVRWANLAVPSVVMEGPDFTKPFATGWVRAVQEAITAIDPPEQSVEARTVNLVGISLWEKHWEGSISELKRLLSLCGIWVHAVINAGCTVEQLRTLRKAAANVVIHEELGSPLGEWLEDRYDMPTIFAPDGAPIGFDAAESWIRRIGEAMEWDMTPALEDIARTRRKAAEKIYRFCIKTGLPKGATFAVAAEASLALPLCRWFHEYLSMIPAAVQVSNEDSPLSAKLKDYLSSIGCDSAWNAELRSDSPPDVVLGNEAMILRAMSEEKLYASYDITMPSKTIQEFIPRSLLGPQGAMWILEGVLNGLWKLIEAEG